jgi:RimJ/RimL family protein N-acetyltransferase
MAGTGGFGKVKKNKAKNNGNAASKNAGIKKPVEGDFFPDDESCDEYAGCEEFSGCDEYAGCEEFLGCEEPDDFIQPFDHKGRDFWDGFEDELEDNRDDIYNPNQSWELFERFGEGEIREPEYMQMRIGRSGAKGSVKKRTFESLNEEDKNNIRSQIREYMDLYIEKHRRMPKGTKKVVARMLESCAGGPVLYTESVSLEKGALALERKLAAIEKGILPREISSREMNENKAVMGIKKENMEIKKTDMKVLETERLIFRKLTLDDGAQLLDGMMRDKEIMEYWGRAYTRKNIKSWIYRQMKGYPKRIGYLGAVSKETGELIGQMGLACGILGEVTTYSIGCMVKRDHWGKGYATEGAKALAQFAFAELGLNTVFATINFQDKRSIHIAEKIGMEAGNSVRMQVEGSRVERVLYSLKRKT